MAGLLLTDWLVFAMTGAFAGLAAGYLGIGGGMVIVPVLTLYLQDKFPLFEQPTQMAVATSLATILVTGTVAVLSHGKHQRLDWQWLRSLAPGVLFGALLGVWLAASISSNALLLIFALFALLVAARMYSQKDETPARLQPGIWTKHGAGLFIGSFSSLLGIGGGTLSVPLLTAFRVTIHQAVAIASAIGILIAISGSAGFVFSGLDVPGRPPAALGYVYLPAWLAIVLASTLTTPLGTALVHRSQPRRVRRIFALLLLLVALRLLWRALA